MVLFYPIKLLDDLYYYAITNSLSLEARYCR